MRIAAWALLLVTVAGGCGGDKDGAALVLPKVYPPVRASTPTGLIADPRFTASVAQSLAAMLAQMTGGDTMPGSADGGTMPGSAGGDTMPGSAGGNTMPGSISLGTAVQERLYTPGPTSLLRIVKELDDRVAQLDPQPGKHACLTMAPVSKTYNLPGGQSFTVKLQCLESHGSDWVGFGFATALQASDAGAPASDAGALATEGGGDDFFLVAGQAGGGGGAYHIQRSTGNVEGWIAVADSQAPGNSQVIMHLVTNKAAGSLELALGGSAVGFCTAHLKTDADSVFIKARINAPPPPGTPAGSQHCAAERTGCFASTALATDLGAGAAACADIAPGTFQLAVGLDASNDAGANVTPSTIYTYFNQPPAGVPAF